MIKRLFIRTTNTVEVVIGGTTLTSTTWFMVQNSCKKAAGVEIHLVYGLNRFPIDSFLCEQRKESIEMKIPLSVRQGNFSSFVFLRGRQQAEHQGEDHEHDGDPRGHPGQAGVGGPGLVLGQEGVRAAGDGAGQARALAGLEHHHGDEADGHDEIDDGQHDLGGGHLTQILSYQRAWPAQVSDMIPHLFADCNPFFGGARPARPLSLDSGNEGG